MFLLFFTNLQEMIRGQVDATNKQTTGMTNTTNKTNKKAKNLLYGGLETDINQGQVTEFLRCICICNSATLLTSLAGNSWGLNSVSKKGLKKNTTKSRSKGLL